MGEARNAESPPSPAPGDLKVGALQPKPCKSRAAGRGGNGAVSAGAERGTMRRASACRTRPEQRHLPWAANDGDRGRRSSSSSKAGPLSRWREPGPGTPWRLLLLLLVALLALGVRSCQGVPVMSHVLQGEKVWNEIDDMCSAIPARDSLPQPSNALEEFCFMVLEFLQKDKPSVTHPWLPPAPQLQEELRIPGGVQSRGYFMFRPRNGRRSAALY